MLKHYRLSNGASVEVNHDGFIALGQTYCQIIDKKGEASCVHVASPHDLLLKKNRPLISV
jgi:hypothetical protein